MRLSAEELLSELSANASRPFSEARSLPPGIYHDAEILKLEIDQLFRREWICIGRLAEIPATGDYICMEIADSPVFVVRQPDGGVKAFANVCAHRASRLLDSSGHISRISCPYHSWTYELNGQLIGAPFMSETPGFDVSTFRLTELSCDQWEGFVYVSLASDAAPISRNLAGLTEKVSGFRMGDYVPVFAQDEFWDANWKCLVENYMDAYHIHRVHKNSFGKYGSSEDQTHLFDGEKAFTYHYVQEDQGARSVQAHAANTWLMGNNRTRTWLINIFPSHTMQLQPDMLWYLSILPVAVNQLRVRWAVSVPKEILGGAKDRQGTIDEVMSLVSQVNSEDKPIVENVFRTTASPEAGQGPLSYLERNVWQFGCYLARNLCG